MTTDVHITGYVAFSPEEETLLGLALMDLLDGWSSTTLEPATSDLMPQLLGRAGFTCHSSRRHYNTTSIEIRMSGAPRPDLVPLLHFLATIGLRLQVTVTDQGHDLSTRYVGEHGALTEQVTRRIWSADEEAMAAHAHALAMTELGTGSRSGWSRWVAQELAWTA